MSDRPKPSIPAWQRAQPKPAPPPQDDPVYSQPESNPIESGESERTTTAAPVEDAASEEPESVPSDTTSPTTAPPAEALEAKPSVLEASDFARYQQQQQEQQSTRSLPQQRPIAPPIITYPEFLVDAHKPPPLITPARVINTLYVAGGLSALLYGAGKWLVSPMVDALTESRHDLLSHSQSKVDELNERLSKIVSKVPEGKKDPAALDTDDLESVSSDPTELYHRDMGTQTSPLPSRRPSIPEAKKSAVDHETSVLKIMQSHIAELSDSSDKVGDAHKDRQITINKLRHYLDGMVYNMDGMPTWEAASDGVSMKPAAGTVKQDGIEDLKKEIRGVKGVLLSAKNFAAARPAPA